MSLPHIDQVSASNTFVVASGALRVTDPCYDMGTWCAGQLDAVMDGIWEAHVGYHKDAFDEEMTEKWLAGEEERINEMAKRFGENGDTYTQFERERLAKKRAEFAAHPGRVAYLHIVNIGAERHFDHMAELDSTWENSGIHVGVDSGQAGFFDLEMFATVCKEEAVKDKFYDEICDLTLADASWGVHPTGVVSSSGYGDGGYDCLVRRVDGVVVEAMLVYLWEEEPQDEEDEELESDD